MRQVVSQRSLLVGDILELHTRLGYVYAQCTHKDSFHGPLIQVLAGIYTQPIADISLTQSSEVRFSVFLLWGKTTDHTLVRKVGRLEVPEARRTFPLFKVGIVDPKSKKVATWWLWDGEREWKVGRLKKDEENLSCREIWDEVLLVSRLENNWLPRDDV